MFGSFRGALSFFVVNLCFKVIDGKIYYPVQRLKGIIFSELLKGGNLMFGTVNEECGVFGVYGQADGNAAGTVYYGLFSLQHRGQEGCGISVNDDGVFRTHKDLGLVSEVFTDSVMKKLGKAQIAVGHTRYGTTGGNSPINCQPIEVRHIKGSMAIAHNGNLTNALELRNELELNGAIFHTTSDTETIAYMITKERLKAPSVEAAVEAAMYHLKGAYSLIIMSPQKLIAVRDPKGMRPLCYGKRKDGSYAVASESCALTAVNAEFIRDVEPGEIVVFDKNGIRTIKTHCKKTEKAICLFEYIYFSRSDSVVDGMSIQEAHLKAGELLAKEYPVDADIVIGVPDSGLEAALGYAKASGIPYGIGFVKNKYIGRTFIAPEQSEREDKVKIKISPIEGAVKGKRVVMIDDSIVRGTTSGRIVQMLRNAGAKEVHMRISSPPFLHPCYYGTDIDSCENLIACNHTTEEIAKMINVDSLGYLSIERAKQLAGHNFDSCCTACFSGVYPTDIPKAGAKDKFECKISENND